MSVEEPQPGHGRRRWSSVQAGRGIAAVLVVLAHTSASVFDQRKYWPVNPVGPLFDFGHAGVEFFFVLSGFIILYAHWDDLGRPGRAGSFVRRRFVRIYPAYWIVLAALTAIFFAQPSFGLGFERDPDVLVSSTTLVAGPRFASVISPLTVIPAAWTLYHEVIFYALFLLLIVNLRLGAGLLAIWFGLSLGPLALPRLPVVAAFYLNPKHLLFAFGLGAAVLLRRRAIPAPLMLSTLGVALFLATGWEEVALGALPEAVRSLLYGLGATAVLIGGVELERQGRLRVPRVLVLLGEASYAIYLIHLAVLVLLAKLVQRGPLHLAAPPLVWYAVFATAAVLAGVGFHLAVERPLTRALSSRRRASELAMTTEP